MKTSLFEILKLSKSCAAKALVFVLAAVACMCPGRAGAFALDSYAGQSRLSSGRWVKISVDQSGVYALTRSTLSRMGFSDPSRVRIYGYGAQLIPDVLSKANYVDDLPMVQSMVGERGSVIFYAQGPERWSRKSNGTYVRTHNHYSERSYYFVTEVEAADSIAPREIPVMGRGAEPGADMSFVSRLHHEKELNTPGESGAELVGEDLRMTPTRKFPFTLDDKIEGSEVHVDCSVVAKTYSRASSFELSATGSSQKFTGSVPATINDGSYYGREGVGSYNFEHTGTRFELTLRHSSPVTVHGAWLSYISINYQRRLAIPSDGVLTFTLEQPSATLGGTVDGVRVWDVTVPSNILAMELGSPAGGKVAWVNSYTGVREYVAFNPSARFPEPRVEGSVHNQNLHALNQADMVIVTLPAWRSQADRLAELHRNSSDSLSVAVVNAADIYNEFGSGAADPGSIRRFFKMVYDRSAAQGRPMRYALIMARYSYDNTASTEEFRRLGIQIIPSCYPSGISASLSDKIGYGTDDIMAMLKDNSGYNIGADKLDVGIGRMPVRDLEEATSDVDKLEDYMKKSRNTTWRNQILMLVDDQDSGVHMRQANAMSDAFNPEDEPRFVVNKVFLDAFKRVGSCYPQAREAMFRYLDEGVMFWIYLGHANNHQWTHDGQLTFTDINELYLKHIPAVFAGTCEFARWDSNVLSGAEILYHERYGGTVSLITATRPVYISDNGMYAEALGRALGSRDSDGSFWRMGDLYRLSKNDIRDSDGRPISDTNRLRYVLIGDPALKLVMPDNLVKLETIDGVSVDSGDDSEKPVIPALGRPRLSGSVTDPNGNVLSDFNGTLQVTIFDASHSTTSNGYGEQGQQVTFEEHGSKLYTGIIPVEQGRFDSRIAMPAEIADNFRPALASFYAFDEHSGRDAAGVSADFYVYGIDEQAAPDTIAPRIDALLLNSEDFRNGGTVNASPTMIARVSDDVAINISSAGVGHQMTVMLDGNRSYNNVSDYFTPSADGTPSGQVVYPLENLMPGNHTLSFRVWDTTGNSAEASIDFFVDQNVAPRLYDVYTDSNPASTSANFYITTDRPDQMVTVTVTVYNLLGHPLWSKTATGLNDMFTTTPLNWNLCDGAGRRVSRGIYLYRATITDNGETFETASRRIAVTAR